METEQSFYQVETRKMEIQNFDNIKIEPSGISLFDEIFQRRQIGFVVRNFLSREEIKKVKESMEEYPYPRFEVFPGYKAMPRPFDYTLNTDYNDYLKEVEFLVNKVKLLELKQAFKTRLLQLTNNASILFASKDNELSRSKAWASYRELYPEKGWFELHCGNVFKLWNNIFFSHQYKTMEQTHLSCVVLIQKPELKKDIVIYKPHFDEIPEKIDHETLRNVRQEILHVSDIPSFDIELGEGDLLLFDESNYWHIVPSFGGTTSRITFGGFVSKFRNENKYMHWA